MALPEEIDVARKKIYRDGYDMSLGELTGLYSKNELTIQPEYQRLFRWDETRKTRFIESLLLNIPIPPIFVFSGEGGKWELVDGLQRVSTVLEFMGELVDAEGNAVERFACNGTDLLPSLDGKIWLQPEEDRGPNHLEEAQQLAIRRARIRIEILGQETDNQIKFELFQRLNTGGANLTEQEIRNCIIVSLSKIAYDHISEMSSDENFIGLAAVGEERQKRQYAAELIVRFLVLRNFAYRRGLDVHDYLDKGIVNIASNNAFDWGAEMALFRRTVAELRAKGGDDVFRRNNRFSLGRYEFIVLGFSKALERGQEYTADALSQKLAAIDALPEVERYSGSGVRGTQRLSGMIFPHAENFFA